MKIKGLHHVGIAVEDLDASIKFYCDFIGCTLKARFFIDGGVELAQLQLGDDELEILCFPEDCNRSKRGVIDHISFEVEGMDELVESIKELGLKITEEIVTIPGELKFCFFEGPNSERIELKEPLNVDK